MFVSCGWDSSHNLLWQLVRTSQRNSRILSHLGLWICHIAFLNLYLARESQLCALSQQLPAAHSDTFRRTQSQPCTAAEAAAGTQCPTQGHLHNGCLGSRERNLFTFLHTHYFPASLGIWWNVWGFKMYTFSNLESTADYRLLLPQKLKCMFKGWCVRKNWWSQQNDVSSSILDKLIEGYFFWLFNGLPLQMLQSRLD